MQLSQPKWKQFEKLAKWSSNLASVWCGSFEDTWIGSYFMLSFLWELSNFPAVLALFNEDHSIAKCFLSLYLPQEVWLIENFRKHVKWVSINSDYFKVVPYWVNWELRLFISVKRCNRDVDLFTLKLFLAQIRIRSVFLQNQHSPLHLLCPRCWDYFLKVLPHLIFDFYYL